MWDVDSPMPTSHWLKAPPGYLQFWAFTSCHAGQSRVLSPGKALHQRDAGVCSVCIEVVKTEDEWDTNNVSYRVVLVRESRETEAIGMLLDG